MFEKCPSKRRAHYDDGVNRMRETLLLCDYAITTTEKLQKELLNYKDDVFINRNVASEEMIKRSIDAIDEVERDISKVVIGYFSGSITHNEDFNLVLPSIVKLMKKHSNLYLKIAGILTVPLELEQFKERLINVEFMDWRKMPAEIAECDINIAPLTKSLFNEAKSENKWTEASLVNTVTVASNLGAFKNKIKNYKNGVLVNDDEWFEVLDEIIIDRELRIKLGKAAHDDVLNSGTTIGTSNKFNLYIRSKLAKSVAFVIPSTDISGGINVVVKHAEILKKHGYDVTLINTISLKDYKNPRIIEGVHTLVANNTIFKGSYDILVATLWSTLDFVKKYPNVQQRSYFVQNYETNFYKHGDVNRLQANSTYNEVNIIKYTTMSRWCQKWLKDIFNQTAEYASNGIDLQNFKEYKRKINNNNKIKILIEGDSKDHYKNVDESFNIVDMLDKNKFEISYLSYRNPPKESYRVDHFYNKIPPEKVGEIYASCDVLIKSSLLESFSYPPLEMMATGGYVVVVPNDGNIEYLKDKENCLFYEQGNVKDAVKKIETLIENQALQSSLYQNGLKTAEKYAWINIEQDILHLYR
jgi:O-antigen biosynthesis protein